MNDDIKNKGFESWGKIIALEKAIKELEKFKKVLVKELEKAKELYRQNS